MLVQSSEYPYTGSTGAADSTWFRQETWYDTVAEAADGSTIMYGWITKSSTVQLTYMDQLRVFGLMTEDNRLWSASSRIGFVWFSLPGLKRGDRIEEAFINCTVAAASAIAAGEGVFARLDTVMADYAVRGFNPAVTGDAGRFDVTFNNLVQTDATAWVPPLEPYAVADSVYRYWGRYDYHDFGPRSEEFLTSAGALANGYPFRIDVTDALQQHVDNGNAGQGALFIIYGTYRGSTVDLRINCGNNALVTSDGGSPALHVVATSQRGQRAWNGPTPLALSFDDGIDGQIDWTSTLNSDGFLSPLSVHKEALANDSIDSLWSADSTGVYLLHHGRREAGDYLLGGLTGNALIYQVSRSWMQDDFTNPPDTTKIIDYVYGGGEGPVFSWEAISTIADLGFRSARATNATSEATCAIGETSYFAWDWPVNRYAFISPTVNSLFNESSASTVNWRFVKENLMDLVDRYYTDHGRSAIFLYAHSTAQNYITPTNLGILLAVTDSLGCVRFMDYADVISLRGTTTMDPADITEVNGYSAGMAATAARSDSVGIYSPGNELEVWLAPK